MLTREIVHAGHTSRFMVTRDTDGWDVREERDDTVVRKARYGNWHRVERAIKTFELSLPTAGAPER